MPKDKIDGIQLFCLMVLFMFGTAVFLDLGSGARQDAWIVTILSPIAGLAIFAVYYRLYRQHPDLPLTEYVRKILGKYLGSLISYMYIIYFIYIASRVLRDVEELLISSPYAKTSIMTLGICMVFALIYAVHLGFEVFARAGIICFAVMTVTLLLILIFYVISDLIHLENLRPVLANGWKPVIGEIFPVNMTVPYGELVLFTMILPLMKRKTKILKTGSMAIAYVGIYLTINTIILICILGADLLERSAFPALAAVGYIEIGGFIQRLDPFIILLIVFLGFIKVGMFFYCAVIGMNNLFKMKPNVFTSYFMGGIICLSSIMIAPSYQSHLDEGLKVVPYFLHIAFQFAIPAVLLVLASIQRKWKLGKV